MKSWVFALPTNREFWAWDKAKQRYTPRVVTTEQARRIVEETKRALEHWARLAPAGGSAYTPPVLREHKREGARCGSILDVKLSGVLERRGLWLLVDWLDATAHDIETFKSQHVSIGIDPSYRDGSGEVFGPLIDELSLTEHPRLREIGSIQDTLNLRLADALEQEQVMEEELKALMERIELLESKVAAMEEKAQEAPAEAPEAEMSDEEQPAAEDEEVRASDFEALALRLADLLAPRLAEDLKSQRQGERPAAAPPTGQRKPTTPEAKIKAANAQGLVGIAAIKASLK